MSASGSARSVGCAASPQDGRRSAELSESFLSQVERGRANASVASLKRIAAALGVNVADLFEPNGSGHPRVLRREARRTSRSARSGGSTCSRPAARASPGRSPGARCRRVDRRRALPTATPRSCSWFCPESSRSSSEPRCSSSAPGIRSTIEARPRTSCQTSAVTWRR